MPATPDTSVPATAQPQTAPQPADPAAPTPTAQPADPATAAAAPAPATAAAAPAGAPQVADIVNKEFPVYDKNADGSLSKSEFSTWMLAMKKTANPAVTDDAANKSWTAQAFAQADTDKSKTLSKDELTNFLAQAAKAS